MDNEENVDTQLATEDNAQEVQVDDTESASSTPEEKQVTSETERIYAGKFKSADDLEKSYKELESKLGNHKELEDKARAYEKLSRQQSIPTPLVTPRLSQFVGADGTIDVQAYDNAMEQYNQAVVQTTQFTASRSARIESDAIRAEKDFPFIATDEKAQRAAHALFTSGEVGSLYEAVKEVSELRQAEREQSIAEGAKAKEKELAQKVRSQTERSSAKAGGGNISPETFASMSLEEKRAYINNMVSSHQG